MINCQFGVFNLNHTSGEWNQIRARNHVVFMTPDDNQDHAPVGQSAAMQMRQEPTFSPHFISMTFDDDSPNGVDVLFRGNDDRPIAQALQTAMV
jgi:hypothetical protein